MATKKEAKPKERNFPAEVAALDAELKVEMAKRSKDEYPDPRKIDEMEAKRQALEKKHDMDRATAEFENQVG